MSAIGTLLAIDQGTTSTRAILFEADGTVRHIARRDLRQIYPRPGWVEHNPEEIWQAVVATCREAVAAAQSLSAGRIAAIGPGEIASAAAIASRQVVTTACQISSGSCSTQPGRG